MPVGKESKLGLYVDAIKAWAPTLRVRLGAWWEACRAEPTLIWQTSAIRYGVYGTSAIIGIWIFASIAGKFAPAEHREQARTADFQVICTNPACNKTFVINRKFGFDSFPVKCPACGQKTGVRGYRCNSTTCHGRIVVAKESADGKSLLCSQCGGPLGPAG
jgi:hypothetical protein